MNMTVYENRNGRIYGYGRVEAEAGAVFKQAVNYNGDYSEWVEYEAFNAQSAARLKAAEKDAERRTFAAGRQAQKERKANRKAWMRFISIQLAADVAAVGFLGLAFLGGMTGVPFYIPVLGIAAALVIQQFAGRYSL